ncbi:hypothetical protein F4679DRAFT_582814 [Xylaria curta]|nr:hypothetical protein F4679DRAFT_582814 [Xylaria curta]
MSLRKILLCKNPLISANVYSTNDRLWKQLVVLPRTQSTLLKTAKQLAYPDFHPISRRGVEQRYRAGRNVQEHEKLCEEEAQQLAAYILKQWSIPADQISIQDLELEVIDVASALDMIRPEWERRWRNQELEAYCNVEKAASEIPILTLEATLCTIQQTRRAITLCGEGIFAALNANDGRSTWLRLGAIWPCTTPVLLLETLRSGSSLEFGLGMKEALLLHGLGVTRLQRLYRIRHALLRDDERTLAEELRNPGHEN